jgi:hypothetical protein
MVLRRIGKTASPYGVLPARSIRPPIEVQFARGICSIRFGGIGHRVVERLEKVR